MKNFYSRGNSLNIHAIYCVRSVQRFAVKVSKHGVTIQHAGREGEEYPTNRASCLYTYRVYQKKGNRTLQGSWAFIIQSTEIILSQTERPGF